MYLSFGLVIDVLDICPPDILPYLCKAIYTKMLFVIMVIMAKPEKKPKQIFSLLIIHTHTHILITFLFAYYGPGTVPNDIHLSTYICMQSYNI